MVLMVGLPVLLILLIAALVAAGFPPKHRAILAIKHSSLVLYVVEWVVMPCLVFLLFEREGRNSLSSKVLDGVAAFGIGFVLANIGEWFFIGLIFLFDYYLGGFI